MQETQKFEAAVGFPSGKDGIANPHYDTGASILEVAIWNNFGTEYNPRRPFMDDAAPKIQVEYQKILKEGIPRVNRGEIKAEVLLKAAMLKGEAVIRNQIQTGSYVPNSPDTVKVKKSSKPLIWSGDMEKYVTSILRKRK